MAIGESTGPTAQAGAHVGTGTSATGVGGTAGAATESPGSGLADKAMQQAQAAGERVTEMAREQARTAFAQRQHDFAGQIESVGDALRETAERMQERGQSLPARYIEQAAARVEDFAGAIRERGFEDLVSETETFARRQPELFIGGAVLLGIGVGRFLKASGERRRAGRMSGRQQTGAHGMATASGGGATQRFGSSGYGGMRSRPSNAGADDGDDHAGTGYGGRYASGGLDERNGPMSTGGTRPDPFPRDPAADVLSGRDAPSPMGAGAGGRGAPLGGAGAGGLGDTGSGRAGTPGSSGIGSTGAAAAKGRETGTKSTGGGGAKT